MDSTSASDWQFPALAQSVTWNGKRSPSRTWLRRFRTASWTRRLFGAISPPSTAQRGVERWIGSLGVSRASRTAPPASGGEPTTNETSGQSQPASSAKSDPASSSWRTFQASQGITTNESGQTYEQWATGLRKDYSARLRSVRRTSDSGSLSWPTPTGRDEKDRGHAQNSDRPNRGPALGRDVLNWPTPTTAPEAPNENSKSKDGGHRNMVEASQSLWQTATSSTGAGRYGRDQDSLKLDGAARQWPTVTANTASYANGERGQNLIEAARVWPSPMAADGERQSSAFKRGNPTLPGAASQRWPTPRGSDGEKSGGPQNDNLPGQVRHFPTPNANAQKGFTSTNGKGRASDFRAFSPLARRTSKPGHECSPKCRRLNPHFVTWLMGWPPLAIDHTDSDSLAMAWSLWWRLMRSELSRLGHR